MEFSNGSERWEDEQLHTLELALGFSPGTITLADIEYLIQRSCAEFDDSEDDDLCFSMQYCQVSPPPLFFVFLMGTAIQQSHLCRLPLLWPGLTSVSR